MPQLHFSIDERTAREIARLAAAEGLSVSRFVARLVKQSVPDAWPAGYIEAVAGSCSDAPLEAPGELAVEDVTL